LLGVKKNRMHCPLNHFWGVWLDDGMAQNLTRNKSISKFLAQSSWLILTPTSKMALQPMTLNSLKSRFTVNFSPETFLNKTEVTRSFCWKKLLHHQHAR
jgi:hypothetical protein